MEKYGSAKLGTVNFKKSKFVCRGCNRTLDDCVFVDESTKLFTPYCKTCRSVMKDESRCHQVCSPIESKPSRSQDASVSAFSDGSAPNSEKIPTSTPTVSTNSTTKDSVVLKVVPYPKFPSLHFSIVYGAIPCSKWAVLPSNHSVNSPFQATLIYHRSYSSSKYL